MKPKKLEEQNLSDHDLEQINGGFNIDLPNSNESRAASTDRTVLDF